MTEVHVNLRRASQGDVQLIGSPLRLFVPIEWVRPPVSKAQVSNLNGETILVKGWTGITPPDLGLE